MRRIAKVSAALVLLLCAAPAAAEVMPIQGTWELDTRNSQNIPDSAKGVDLKIVLKGHDLMTQRLVDGAPVGSAFVITLDGVLREREIVPGQRGVVSAEWKANGKLIVQTIKMKAGVLDTVQTTNITISESGDVMTRVQTIKTGAGVVDRVLIYRRKK